MTTQATQSIVRRALIVAGLLVTAAAPGLAADGLEQRERQELLNYARDTWRSVAEMGTAARLPVDGLMREADGSWKPSRQTTPTDIGAYLWSTVASQRLGIIGKDDAENRLRQTLLELERLERVHGFLFDRIDPSACAASRVSPKDGSPRPLVLSCVDNGWLAAGLIIVRNSCPSLRARADRLVNDMDFGFFYVPYDAADPVKHPGQVHGPYRIDREAFGGFHQLLNTEQRIYSYIGIARGQIPAELYYRLRRTLPADYQKQRQTPQGIERTYLNIPVFEGHYTYRGMRVVPSWGGSMFEALMVTLFVPEERWAPRSWGVNHPLYVRTQIEFGLNESGYGYWGFSPACNPSGGYRTYGVEALASDPNGYTSYDVDVPANTDDTKPKKRHNNGIVTPHASFLAIRFAPHEAMDNLRKLKENFPIYTDRGFIDSVNISTGTLANCVLMLDQGMIMAAIANALADDAMRRAFADPRTEKILAPLMGIEEFTAGPTPAETPTATGSHKPSPSCP